MNRTLTTIVAAAFIGAAGAAHAEDILLTLDRNELQSAQGREHVYGQMQKVAKSFCQEQSRVSYKAFLKEKACIADVTTQLVSSSHNADIAALHTAAMPARTGF